MNYETMTTEAINERIKELSMILDGIIDANWSKAYTEYNELMFILDERYREENQDSFTAYYKEHIKGKKFTEIPDSVWEFYSDWHKDMYGFRPRIIF